LGKKLQELETKRKVKFNYWSREGCMKLLQRGLNEGEGLYPPPHVLSYKPIGMQLPYYHHNFFKDLEN
jgi:hypothetical protein